MENKRVCFLCKSDRNAVVFQEFGVDVVRCRECGHVFSTYKRDPNYDQYFGGQAVKPTPDVFFVYQEARERSYNDFCKAFIVGKQGKLLDVGCGLGFFLHKMKDFPRWEIAGCEVSRTAIDFAKNILGVSNLVCGPVESAGFEKNSFDVITLWDVIEHIPEPDALLRRLRDLLKEDGILFIHTPNVSVALPGARLLKTIFGMRAGIHYLEAMDHVHLYSPKTIKKLLSDRGFPSVEFLHIHPLQTFSGRKSFFGAFVRNIKFYISVWLSRASLGRMNFDNLSVSAKKSRARPSGGTEIKDGSRLPASEAKRTFAET